MSDAPDNGLYLLIKLEEQTSEASFENKSDYDVEDKFEKTPEE